MDVAVGGGVMSVILIPAGAKTILDRTSIDHWRKTWTPRIATFCVDH